MYAFYRACMILLAIWLCWGKGAIAHHELDLLFGYEHGALAVMQPIVHPVRTMVHPQPNLYLLDVGMDFFVPDGWLTFMLQRCRVQQVWISPMLIGTKSGLGTVFSAGNTPNFFDLPFAGTPHHHFLFRVTSPGVYVWDLRATHGVDYLGRALADMPIVYRIYMVAGNPAQLYGSVVPSPLYRGNPYELWISVRIRRQGALVDSEEQPINPWAIDHYRVGFMQTGQVQAAAKLSKHLSVVHSINLSGAQRRDWFFSVLGDTNEDDRINADDVQHVAAHFGSQRPSADLTGEGVVNLDDLYLTLVNYGQSGQELR